MRVPLLELADDKWQDVLARGRAGADGEPAGLEPLDLPDRLFHIVGEGEYSSRVAEYRGADVR